MAAHRFRFRCAENVELHRLQPPGPRSNSGWVLTACGDWFADLRPLRGEPCRSKQVLASQVPGTASPRIDSCLTSSAHEPQPVVHARALPPHPGASKA